jgi:hypothetical protein
MLRAHANMPIKDFISQLRTYVIAMGLSPQVVDCVDRLADEDAIEEKHAAELQEAEDARERETKDEILEAVEEWLDEYADFSESQRASLLNAIKAA